MFDDFDLIISSFQTQYGLRLSRDLKSMKWDEFVALISGLGPETPLGRMVAIRSENDKDNLKHFTYAQRRIHKEWREKQSKNIDQTSYDKAMLDLENMFRVMAGRR